MVVNAIHAPQLSPGQCRTETNKLRKNLNGLPDNQLGGTPSHAQGARTFQAKYRRENTR